MADFLDEKRREITVRLNELEPLVEEYTRLQAAASALASVGGSSSRAAGRATPRRRGPGRPRPVIPTSKAPKAAKATRKPGRPASRRAGRRRGSGTRAAEALSFVQSQPGITIPELAAKMSIKQNYLYRVLPSLQREGKVVKQGRGWHPRAGWEPKGP